MHSSVATGRVFFEADPGSPAGSASAGDSRFWPLPVAASGSGALARSFAPAVEGAFCQGASVYEHPQHSAADGSLPPSHCRTYCMYGMWATASAGTCFSLGQQRLNRPCVLAEARRAPRLRRPAVLDWTRLLLLGLCGLRAVSGCCRLCGCWGCCRSCGFRRALLPELVALQAAAVWRGLRRRRPAPLVGGLLWPVGHALRLLRTCTHPDFALPLACARVMKPSFESKRRCLAAYQCTARALTASARACFLKLLDFGLLRRFALPGRETSAVAKFSSKPSPSAMRPTPRAAGLSAAYDRQVELRATVAACSMAQSLVQQPLQPLRVMCRCW